MSQKGIAPFTQLCTFPYLHGVYQAVNAVSDVALLVDAPSCAFFKAEQIHGTHCLESTLLDASSRHRIVNTGLHVNNIAEGNLGAFKERFAQLMDADRFSAILYTSFPMASIIGTPYDILADEVRPHPRKPVVPIRGRSLEADWLEGFEDSLEALARHLPLTGSPTSGRVAVIGHFMHRNEGDFRGNVEELCRLLRDLDLEVSSVWLDGGPVAGLARAGEAETLIALPYGEPAARALAQRTGARVLLADLPFGVHATDRLIRTVAEATSRNRLATEIIHREHKRWLPGFRNIALKRTLDSQWGFAGDPAQIPGFCEIAEFLGATPALLIAWTSRRRDVPVRADLEDKVQFNLNSGDFFGLRAAVLRDVDVVVGNSLVHEHFKNDLLRRVSAIPEADLDPARLAHWIRIPFVEFGYPSANYHARFGAPFLGYAGFACFVDRVAGQLRDASFMEFR